MNPTTGSCRHSGGPLDIIDAGNANATVACSECGDTYVVEADDDGEDYDPGDVADNLEENAEPRGRSP